MSSTHLQDLARILQGVLTVASHSGLAQRLSAFDQRVATSALRQAGRREKVSPAAAQQAGVPAAPAIAAALPATASTAVAPAATEQVSASAAVPPALHPQNAHPAVLAHEESQLQQREVEAALLNTSGDGAQQEQQWQQRQQQEPAAAVEPVAAAAPAPMRFQPRERSVPSNPMSRVAGFAGLGASLLYGAAKESVSRAFRPKPEAGTDAAAPQSALLSEANAERLAAALCRMRGAALKLGQLLSIQDENVLPPAFSAALERVRAGADVMPRRQLEKVLNAELGRGWEERLASFDFTPLAAASIGQVHGATLHDGRRVVMKVQYPGVARSIESDVDNLMRLVSLTALLPEGLYVENAAAVAKRELALECDYGYEAAAQGRFAGLVAADPWAAAHFHVPGVVPELSSERVLASEWVPGVPIDRVASMPQEVRDRVGSRLLQLTLKELFHWRFMQTDPNWGNFLYDEASDRLHLIDFGAAKEYSAAFVDDYLAMVAACAGRDRGEVIARSQALGFLTGDESRVMLDAHCEAGFMVGVPFGHPGMYDFGRHGGVTRRVTELGAVMLKHRLTPPPDESYSLHRKLSGAFLACIRLKARVPARQLFQEAREEYERRRAAAAAGEQQLAAAA